MNLEGMMESIAGALPEITRRGTKTVREVCLTFSESGWHAMAGGHPAVHIGEYGGDFDAYGETAEAALLACLESVRNRPRSIQHPGH